MARRFRREASHIRQRIPNERATVRSNRSSRRFRARASIGRGNSMRMKNDPPSGSVVCWWELMMLAPASCRKCETAATMPGRSAHEISSRVVAITSMSARSVAYGGRGELRDEAVLVEALEREGGDEVGRAAGGDELG